MTACAAVMLLAMPQVSFADDEWNVESVSFTPASDTVRMSDIMKRDNDGPYKLDLAYRNSSLLNYCFFAKNDRCVVTYRDGSTKEFVFEKIENPQFAVFKPADGIGDNIELEALSTEISREIRNSVEGSADELAAIIGPNRLQIEYGVYDPETGLGQRVLCDCTMTVIEDKGHDCTKALRERNQNEPTCGASGFSADCLFCQICGNYYADTDASRLLSKKDVFLPALGHSWRLDKAQNDSGIVEETYVCGRKGCKESLVIRYEEGHSHELSHVAEIPAACTEMGQKACLVCEGCGAKFRPGADEPEPVNDEELVIATLGHDWGYKVDTPATCTADGSRSIHCSRCDAVKDGTEEVIPATGHSYGAWKTVKKASETAAGQKKASCSNGCGRTETAVIRQLAPTLPAVAIIAPKAGRRSATVRWKKVSAKNKKKIGSIQIQYSQDRKFSKGVRTVTAKKTAASKKISRLKSKKKYYVRIRSYSKVKGVEHVSKWSAVKTVKVK